MPDRLLFIDTNIWLDFYRVGNETNVGLLKHVTSLADNLITTYQVETEFKSNRQTVLLTGLKDLSLAAPGRIGIVSGAKAATELKRLTDAAIVQVKELKKQLEAVLTDPEANDPIFRDCLVLFKKNDGLSLMRNNPIKKRIRRRALTRFLHHCPPRKKGDVSIGDAFNWEWIVRCAHERKADVAIVTRDTDYGIVYAGKNYINDHLKQEFHERIGDRTVTLFSLLGEALKTFGIAVTKKEAEEEQALVKEEMTTAQRGAELYKLWSDVAYQRSIVAGTSRHRDLISLGMDRAWELDIGGSGDRNE